MTEGDWALNLKLHLTLCKEIDISLGSCLDKSSEFVHHFLLILLLILALTHTEWGRQLILHSAFIVSSRLKKVQNVHLYWSCSIHAIAFTKRQTLGPLSNNHNEFVCVNLGVSPRYHVVRVWRLSRQIIYQVQLRFMQIFIP